MNIWRLTSRSLSRILKLVHVPIPSKAPGDMQKSSCHNIIAKRTSFHLIWPNTCSWSVGFGSYCWVSLNGWSGLRSNSQWRREDLGGLWHWEWRSRGQLIFFSDMCLLSSWNKSISHLLIIVHNWIFYLI